MTALRQAAAAHRFAWRWWRHHLDRLRGGDGWHRPGVQVLGGHVFCRRAHRYVIWLMPPMSDRDAIAATWWHRCDAACDRKEYWQ